ncbi:MAG: hypothetical protein AAB425_06640, partial [Bdellovibrionota bacterium]
MMFKKFLALLLAFQVSLPPLAFGEPTVPPPEAGADAAIGGARLDPETEAMLRAACHASDRWFRAEDLIKEQFPEATAAEIAKVYVELGWSPDDIITVLEAPETAGATPRLVPIDCTLLGFTGNIHQGHLEEGEGPCPHVAGSAADPLGEVPAQNMTDAGEAAAQAPQCTNPPDFKKDLFCEGARSMLQASVIGIAGQALSSATGYGAECVGLTKPTCLTSVISGIIDDLWSNVTGLWEIGSGIVSYGYKTIAGWFSSEPAQAIEDHSGDAAIAAARADDSMLDQFLDSPGAFISNMVSQLWSTFTNYMTENFMCAKWSGVPHYSTCERPLESWECAPWGTKMHAVCGLAGILGGEALVAWLTAGAGTIIVKGAKAASVAAWGSKLVQGTIGVQRAAKIAQVGGTASRWTGSGVSAAADVLSHGGSAKTVANAGKAVQLGATLLTIPTRVPMAVLRKIAVIPGIRHYLEFLGRAVEDGAMRGGKLADRLFVPASSSKATTSLAVRAAGAGSDSARSAAQAGASVGTPPGGGTALLRQTPEEGVFARVELGRTDLERLGLPANATANEIKAAHRAAARLLGDPNKAGRTGAAASRVANAQAELIAARDRLLAALSPTDAVDDATRAAAREVAKLEEETARAAALRASGVRALGRQAAFKTAAGTDASCFPVWDPEAEVYKPLPAHCPAPT